MSHLLLASQAADIIGLPATEIARLGQIIVPYASAGGKGRRALYDFRNLVEMHIVLAFASFGVPQKIMQQFLKNLRNARNKWLEENGRDGWIVMDTKWQWGAGDIVSEALLAVKQPSAAIVVHLAPIKAILRERLQEINPMGVRSGGV
jgi:hypothetical protein